MAIVVRSCIVRKKSPCFFSQLSCNVYGAFFARFGTGYIGLVYVLSLVSLGEEYAALLSPLVTCKNRLFMTMAGKLHFIYSFMNVYAKQLDCCCSCLVFFFPKRERPFKRVKNRSIPLDSSCLVEFIANVHNGPLIPKMTCARRKYICGTIIFNLYQFLICIYPPTSPSSLGRGVLMQLIYESNVLCTGDVMQFILVKLLVDGGT